MTSSIPQQRRDSGSGRIYCRKTEEFPTAGTQVCVVKRQKQNKKKTVWQSGIIFAPYLVQATWRMKKDLDFKNRS